MRGIYRHDFPIRINGLRRKKYEPQTPMAFLHHELSAENTVIPFSLSLPASPIKASLAPFQMEFPPQ